MTSAYQDFFQYQEDSDGDLDQDGLFADNLLDCATDTGCDDDSDEEVLDCVIDNTLQMLLLHDTQQGSENAEYSDAVQGLEDVVPVVVREKKRRRPKRLTMWTDNDGSRRPILPKQTFWYNKYVSHPDIEDPQFHKLFRLRFRLPYAQFQELHQRLETESLFARWHTGKVHPWTHVEVTPIPLLLLTTLRYLGRGWTFDDLSENTSISQETIRVFFHKFVEYGSTVLYTQYVRPPQTCHDAREHTSEYEMAGFPGAIGSTDATHILLERVAYRLRQTHIGFKMSHTARTYNITVNHRRQILATTTGHPARWNDKTLALFDHFMMDLKDGSILNDMYFDLYEHMRNADVCDDTTSTPTTATTSTAVRTRRYQGAWLLVDNGYLAWPTTVPPIKTTSSRREIRFSSWLESMRKDVECTFGILKGRWRILKTGIRLSGVECADKIFLTCCALHNWLLETDGLNASSLLLVSHCILAVLLSRTVSHCTIVL